MASIRKRTWVSGGETKTAYQLTFTAADGKRRREQFAKRKEADARRIEVEGQISKGTYRSDANQVTVAAACTEYLDHLRARKGRDERVSEHYLKNTESQIYNYVAPELRPEDSKSPVSFEGGLGHVKLAQLTTKSVNDLRDRMRAAGVGITTTRQVIGSLSRALRHARDNDMVAVNVASGVRVTGRRDEGNTRVTPPSKAAMGALLKAASGAMKTRLMFAAASGLRASELHELRWSDLDLKGGEVRVRRSLDAYGNIGPTKSLAGKRDVPLGAGIIAALKVWKAASKHSRPSDLVFPNTVGGHTSHRNMAKRDFKPLIAAVAAEDESFRAFGWHALRHFAISTWIEAGLPPKTVQTLAGHSTLAVTMDRYGHLFPSTDHRDAMDKIAAEIFA